MTAALDPGVELLPDAPIARAADDLLARGAIATRLVELACAQPTAAPRVVALTGPAGSGKTSVLGLVGAALAERGDVAYVAVDAAAFPGAEALLAALLSHLTGFFGAQGVVDTTDAVRDALAGYGEIVSGIARIAGVKVDVAGALRRSPQELRDEIAEMAHEVGKRIVIAVDHVDRLPTRELVALIAALRFYALIPYVTIVLTLDRRAVARRLDVAGDLERAAVERLVQVELALPPPDRVLLARVIAGGLARIGERLGRDIDAALHLFDPDDDAGAAALDLVESPRDAKRVINAIAAALPLVPAGADLADACLELTLRLLVPELDGPRLDARARLADTPAVHAARLAELEASLSGHPRAPAAIAALRALFRGNVAP